MEGICRKTGISEATFYNWKKMYSGLGIPELRRCLAASRRSELPVFSGLQGCRNMDFVADSIFDGLKIRYLTIVDNYSWKCMAIHVGQGTKGTRVIGTLEIFGDGKPKKLQMVNGSKFMSKKVDRWAYEQNVELIFSSPGKPTDNPYIESFKEASGTSA